MIEISNNDVRKINDLLAEINLLQSLLIKKDCNLTPEQVFVYNNLINEYLVLKNEKFMKFKFALFKSYNMPKHSIFVEIDNKNFIK
jgi:hypothetical protein